MADERYIEIKIRFEWQEAEPDGSECRACGEVIFLKSWKLGAVLDPPGILKLESFSPDPGPLCQACYDCIRDLPTLHFTESDGD